MKFENLGLKENPFRLTPPINQQEIIWAGMKDVKEKIEDRIKISLLTRPSRIVINWGSYGSGKTHAALYFSKTDRLQELVEKNNVEKAKSIKVTLPRTSKNIVQEFLRSFLGQYSLEDIRDDFLAIRDKIGEDALAKRIDAFSNDGIIANVFKKLVGINIKKQKGLFNNEEIDDDFQQLKNYIYGDSTKGTLNYLGLSYGLNNDEQIANFLATIIGCLTLEKEYYSSFFIWLDEFEDIDTLSKSLQDRFTTFLRQFIDKTPNNLTIFINFTQKPFMSREDMSLYLGEALTTRIGVQIDFAPLSIEEAKIYVKEMFNEALMESKPIPISDEDISYILSHIGNLTARKINESFSIILEMALIKEKKTINRDFINQIKQEIISWEE
ncbi:hypothetical protein CSPB12327_07000 [Campylobacter sp. RM12327]|uniref:hypothetical protein n=1 Tax=Campylobacter sputorum TaxID=206 RepID=UPI000B77A1DB|nr:MULTISPECIES: hypothetical protein [Campylobacter]ASM40159.1 hypothetical protein CSPB_0945 [Campylobacter sputorum]MBE7358543.1 hypothetical protein [Campylobacter sp. RM11302]MBF6669885.1 hypothetical protein [Campylobacter sp. RM12327]MBF6675141.1 hypothetical protein [Campylobacter sp. RM13538]MBF6676437.1 hypothetical protein [Campylobacter sp. RM12321]